MKKIAIAFKESRRVWFRDRLNELGVTEADALATQLVLLVDGSIAQDLVARRSRDGPRGEGSGEGAAAECGVDVGDADEAGDGRQAHAALSTAAASLGVITRESG